MTFARSRCAALTAAAAALALARCGSPQGPAAPPAVRAEAPDAGPPARPPQGEGGAPDAGAAPPPRHGAVARWLVTRKFPVGSVAPDGAGGAFLASIQLPFHRPFGNAPLVVGSDLLRVDAAGHVRWTRTFGPVAGCGVLLGGLLPLPGGHVAAAFSPGACSAPVPELGGETLDGGRVFELDGDGRFVRLLSAEPPMRDVAASDGGLLGLSGPDDAPQLVKLRRDGTPAWSTAATDGADERIVRLAPDRAGGAVLLVVAADPSNPTTAAGLGTALFHVRRYAGEVRNVLLSLHGDGTPGSVGEEDPAVRGGASRLLAVEDSRELAPLGDGGILAYAGCFIAAYTARLEERWRQPLAVFPPVPTGACRQAVPIGGAAAASPSLVVLVGGEDGPGDFGGGLVSALLDGGFAVALEP